MGAPKENAASLRRSRVMGIVDLVHMAKVYASAWMDGKVVSLADANLSVASSAVLYGLSVYTVFPVCSTENGLAAFRLADHERRLRNSAKIIGIDADKIEDGLLERAARELVAANSITENAFMRATLHVTELVPGVRSRGLATALSIFAYEAVSILPAGGARLKTSAWRRVPDISIPSRAKVNGAYVNSVLGKQDALDAGYDDCLFLDASGHVCELSAANLFLVRDGVLITPSHEHDLLEGISRRTVLELARNLGYPVQERAVDLTELYIADEAFACGTSANLTPILEVDARKIGAGAMTEKLRAEYLDVLHGRNASYSHLLTPLG